MRRWARILMWSVIVIGVLVLVTYAFGETAIGLLLLGFIAGGIAGQHSAAKTGEQQIAQGRLSRSEVSLPSEEGERRSAAREAAIRVLEYVYRHVGVLKSRPPDPARQMAAAGLMRCCALLKGILVLDQAGMRALAGILARQHWETWLVSLYTLLGGDEALQVVAGDDIYWKRRLSEKLRFDQNYHPDWAGKVVKLNYKAMYDRVIELLRERESVDGPGGVTGYDVTYGYQSLFSLHANLATIGPHLVYADDEWGVTSEAASTTTIDPALTPVLHTVHLAQYVFKEFGLDGDAMDPFVAHLLVSTGSKKDDA